MRSGPTHSEGMKIREELVDILPELRLYARSLTYSVADAEDLVSETCVRVLERESQFDPGRSLIAWVIRICRNLNIDKSRSRRWRREQLEIVEKDADSLSCKTIEDRLELSEVHRFIHQLPLEQREVLILKGGGYRYDEIAERLNIPRGTVMSRLHRGRKALEELINRKVAV